MSGKALGSGRVRGVRGGHYANEDQKRMKAIWGSKAWLDRRNELLKEHPRCEWCNGHSRVVNHRRQGYYEGYELCKREEVDIICMPCHEHWTKTGQKRHRLRDDCASCGASIYLGRKICYRCGSTSIISKSHISEEQKQRYIGILKNCREVHVGDRWTKIWSWADQVIEVLGFEGQDLPWPLVKTSSGSVGLPAFIFGELVAEGEGQSSNDLESSM